MMPDVGEKFVSETTRVSNAGFLEICRFFLRHIWLLSALSIISGVLGFSASYLVTPVYRAEITLVSVEQSGGGGISSILSNLGGLGRFAGLGNSQTRREDEALALLRSRTFVFDFIAANDGLAVMYPDLWDSESGNWQVSADAAPSNQDAYISFTRSIMGVSKDNDSGIISVTINLEDRFIATRWANDIIRMLNEEFRNRVSAEAQKSMEYLEEELNTASSVGLRQVIHRLIESQIQTIMLTNVRKEFVFRVIDPAAVPDGDRYVSPRRIRIAFVGLLIGGFLGLCIAAFRDALHRGARLESAKNIDN